jgi:outer membrane protein OmpA-like peptidoglycan-associated protein
MLRLIVIIFFIFNIQFFGLKAQNFIDSPNSPRPTYGIFFDLNLNLLNPTSNLIGVDFPNRPSCCPGFGTGSGIGYTPGLFFSFPVSDDIDLMFRASYKDLSGKLSKTEPIPVYNPSTQSSTNGEFEHSIDSKVSSAGLGVYGSYKMSDEFRINAGLQGGYLLQKTYKQKEQIVNPSFGTFVGSGSRIRNSHEGDLPNASGIELSISLGVSYDLPLNASNTFFLVPEVYYHHGLTNLESGESWNVSSLVGGLGLKYAPRKTKKPKPPAIPPPPPPLPPPPPPPSVPLLDASILAVGVNPDGSESNVSLLRVEEFLSQRMHPLLNFIFFEENSSNIPDRYRLLKKNDVKQFTEKQLYNLQTIEVYHNVLNVIGRRVAAFPQAELTLIGCNSDEGLEKGNQQLSQNRAEAVKNYLTSVWNIDESRIKIQSRNLPENPSNLKDPDGIQENRRVEIKANIPQIFEPLVVQDTLREANPPVFRFKPKVNTPIGIDNWKILTSQRGKFLKTFSGTGNPPQSVEWDLSKDATIVPRFDEPLDYKLEIIDKDNKIWESPVQQLPVEQLSIEKKMIEMIADKEIDRFSLILFGFDKADLGPENLKIAEIAKRRIRPNSTVKIEGFSDRVGDFNHNLDLSQRRAIATARALNVDPKFATGLGESKLLYDNDLPEGRFYCRTVNIEIVTPIEIIP